MLYFDFTPFPELNSDRLNLRKLTHMDATDFFGLRSNSNVLTYLDRHPEHSVKEVFSIIDSIDHDIKSNKSILWVICEKDANKLIGTIGFWKTDPFHHRAEIGYLLHPDYWGKGYMDEAIRMVIDYAWNVMRLHTIEANINPANAASKNVLLKNGFKVEGYFHESYHFDGKFLDAEILSLIRS